MKAPETWVRISRCRDIPLREGRAVKVGNREIAVFNLGDRFLAIENRCPHKGGPLADGIVSGTTVVCPLHASMLSLETVIGVHGPSASSCVETFRTRVEDGTVLVDLSQKRAGPEKAGDRELAGRCVPSRGVAVTTDYPSRAAG